jgi:hypothetical protein
LECGVLPRDNLSQRRSVAKCRLAALENTSAKGILASAKTSEKGKQKKAPGIPGVDEKKNGLFRARIPG